ncbi:MAG: EamA family transporter [Bacteroidia bacterium]|jgi:drug/metabolite transporter (DMT)-like permease|nr:EamA family transporter [Bacteroidia bacterium]
MKQTSNLHAWLAYIAVAIFWGTTFLAIRIGVQSMPPFIMAGIRHLTAGVLIAVFFLVKGYPLPTRKQFAVQLITGFLMLVIGNGLVSWAEIYISSGLAALICALTPLSIIGFNMLLGTRESIKPAAWFGILLCLIAQVLIFRDNLKEFANPQYVQGIVFLLIAITCWGGGSIYVKRNQTGMHPLFGASFQMMSAGLVLLVLGSSLGEWNQFNPAVEAWWSIAYLVVFGSLIGYGSFMYILKHLPATIVSTYAYINTIVAVLLGWFWLNEKLNAGIAIAVLLTICGVYLVNHSFASKPPKSDEPKP